MKWYRFIPLVFCPPLYFGVFPFGVFGCVAVFVTLPLWKDISILSIFFLFPLELFQLWRLDLFWVFIAWTICFKSSTSLSNSPFAWSTICSVVGTSLMGWPFDIVSSYCFKNLSTGSMNEQESFLLLSFDWMNLILHFLQQGAYKVSSTSVDRPHTFFCAKARHV